MNAVTQDIFHKADELSADVRQPFPASRKISVGGGNGIRVPMREISLSATKTANGIEPNPSVTVYDTSGPYSDPDVTIDLRMGHRKSVVEGKRVAVSVAHGGRRFIT